MMDFKTFVEDANADIAGDDPKTGSAAASRSSGVPADDEAPSMWSTVGAVSAINNETRAVASRRSVTDRPQAKKSASSQPIDVAISEQSSVVFPVGWLVVIAGPDRGTCLTLQKGVSRIDRSDTDTILLATAASERSLATIVYDADKNGFFIGEPDDVYPVKPLNDGDVLKFDTAQLRFVALCNASFDWTRETEIAQ